MLCTNGLYRTTPTNGRLLETSGFRGFRLVSSGNRMSRAARKADETPARISSPRPHFRRVPIGAHPRMGTRRYAFGGTAIFEACGRSASECHIGACRRGRMPTSASADTPGLSFWWRGKHAPQLVNFIIGERDQSHAPDAAKRTDHAVAKSLEHPRFRDVEMAGQLAGAEKRQVAAGFRKEYRHTPACRCQRARAG